MTIPEDVSDVQAGRLWKDDRLALVDCKASKAALAAETEVITTRAPR